MIDHKVVVGMIFTQVLKQGKVLDAAPEQVRLGISRPWHQHAAFAGLQ
jgi:hypothetical protein